RVRRARRWHLSSDGGGARGRAQDRRHRRPRAAHRGDLVGHWRGRRDAHFDRSPVDPRAKPMSAGSESGGAEAASGPNPTPASVLLEQGKQLFLKGDLEGAHRAFARAHQRAMNDPVAMSWHGLTLTLVEHNSNLGVLY